MSNTYYDYDECERCRALQSKLGTPIPMVLHCPVCGTQHIDAPEPENGWTNPPHKSHLCHACGTVWRPAEIPTVGVAALSKLGSSDTWTPGSANPRDGTSRLSR